ncbi:MAG: nucleotide sugar dehydrogenase [Desulfovibrionaceae bacterium]|nr:nucleotide sugar dehydrogenase [Desulfovibrionaceae bacterium]
MLAYADLLAHKRSIAIVGLGYVGLPLACALAKHFHVIGFDVKEQRIAALQQGHDATNEVDDATLKATTATFTSDPKMLKQAGVIIVAVPTPIDSHRNPDLKPVLGASLTVGQNLSPDTVVCYESTVYPGVTEDLCRPILEEASGFKLGQNLFLGYSPERINPGDKVHRLETICKIVAGSDPSTRKLLAQVYGTVVSAGIHEASSIRVAEAAKVIENTQRDINIALMNELAMIFNKMGIDTLEVLEAAGSKWNFLPFRPGLVGGHCIGVDPYYLTFKAEELGLHPEVILAGRRINDHMGKYVAEVCVKRLIHSGKAIKGARVGILGFTFKENVPDIRNTRVIDIIEELHEYGIVPLVHDPCADKAEAKLTYPNLELLDLKEIKDVDALICAVQHAPLKELDPSMLKNMFKTAPYCVLDLKGMLNREACLEAGIDLWRL